MSGIVFLLSAALLGVGLVRRFFVTTLNHAEQALWGLVIGWSSATAAGYAVARLFGELTFRVGLIDILLVSGVAIFCWWPNIRRLGRREDKQFRFVWEKSFTPLAVLLGLFAPIFLHLFLTHMLPVHADGGIYSGGESTSYDMAYHAAITNSFVHGANFPPVYTPMPPAPLLYPFVPDFLSALLVVLGMDLHSALVCTAVPLSLALTGIFYFFALRLLNFAQLLPLSEARRAWAAASATLLFLLNGGLGFVFFFQDWRAAGTGLWPFLSGINVNYTHVAEKGLVWPNVITDMLLPQRTSIFGLALSFIILTCFAITWSTTDDDEKSAWPVLVTAGILAGVLPFFHVHSYVAVGLISGFLFLVRPRRVWLVFWLPAVVLALPRFLEFGGQLATTGFARFQPGWRGQGEGNWILFWIRNAGLPTILIIPAWLSAPRPLRFFYLGFVALLIVALLVVFSPNDYDNMKLMTYWSAGTSVVIAGWLTRLARGRIGLICSIVLVAGSTLSGVLALAYEWRASKLLFGRDEAAVADFIKSHTAPHSLFLTAPSLHQPVLSLAGRAIVRGPTAWLWSHGYPFAEREADVRAIYAGRDDATELLRYYHVDYVYLGRNEATELRANQSFFDATFPTLYRSGEIAIYDTRKLGNNDRAAYSGYPPREYASRIDKDPSQILVEFPAVAFELYRLRKMAFGGLPKYADFMSDLRILGRELYPGTPGWREVLGKNERTLWEEWAARPGFKRGSDSSIEARSAATADYNAAYVLCHYFGYLRRNPDDLPDHDLTGYNFWLAQLNRNADYRGVTRAFIEAEEYKRQDR